MATDRKSRLQEFVAWAAAHISGDEKGEAQVFLDRLLQAFAQKGIFEVGGGTAFADFVWKPLVRIEMKSEAPTSPALTVRPSYAPQSDAHFSSTIAFGMRLCDHNRAWD